MKNLIFSKRMAIVAVAVAGSLSPALGQQSAGRLYAFHTGRIDGCPGLDWHVTVTGNDVEGFVAWDGGKHMARLQGAITPVSAGQARTFKLDAQEIGGAGRKAVVQGTGGGDDLNVSIEGSGSACDGKPLTIPRVVGGLAGGGG